MMSTTVSRRSSTVWYFFLMALAPLIWSAQVTAVKELDSHIGPIAITFLPFCITTIPFVTLLIKMRREGVAGQVLAQLGMTWGVCKSLASNGAILIPVMCAMLASLLLKVRLTVLRIASLLIGRRPDVSQRPQAVVVWGERLNLTALAGAGTVLLSTILVMRYDTSY